MDCVNGYWNIQLDPESRHKTAFMADWKLYWFRVMAMGLKSASMTFQRAIDKVLDELGPNR